MDEPKLFSVITSSFNHRMYMKDWIQSIIKQKYRPLEIIFVDDCSVTHDIDLFKEYYELLDKNNISYKSYRNPERMHCASSYLKALELSTGQYIGVVDSDDALLENAISTVMNAYNSNPDIGFIYTQFMWCDKRLKSARKGFCKMPQKNMSLLDSEFTIKTRHCYSHWRTFKRSDKSETLFKEGMKCSIDKYMGYRLEEIYNGGFINRACYQYRNGIKSGVTKTEKSLNTWALVRKGFKKKRKNEKIKPFPIRLIK